MAFPRLEQLTYEETIRFHGHDGPFLALGYRFGQYLVENYECDTIKGILVKVRLPLRTPFSCFIDGVQCSACTTMGKRNMFAEESHDEKINVEVESGEKTGIYQISEKALDICRNSRDMKSGVKSIFDSSESELWAKIG